MLAERVAPASRALRTNRGAYGLLGVSIAMFGILRLFLAHATYSDLKIYQIEGRAIVHGWNLYGHLPGVMGYATYPPFAAIIFAGTSPLPIVVLEVFNVLLTIVLLCWVSVLAFRMCGLRAPLAPGLVLAACAIWCEPVFTTFGYGQINILLLALVMWDFSRSATARTRGLGVGLAAAIKVTPGIFIVYLLLTRRFRFAATASVTFAATFGLSLAVDRTATWKYWTDYLFDAKRVGRLENAVNQTIRGLLVRIDHSRHTPHAQMLLIVLVLVLGLAIATAAYARLGDAWGLPACAITGLLSSPIAWSHHWVWCVPIFALLWVHARPWLVPAVLIFWSFAVWALPHHNGVELHFSALQIALSGWYVVFGLAFLALTACRVRAARPPVSD
jgi:alpha-1,2-mannosyltransferase